MLFLSIALARKVDRFHHNELDGKWGTVRVSSVKTTDVAVEDIPKLRPWLRYVMPMIIPVCKGL